jgi:hypothetical protein
MPEPTKLTCTLAAMWHQPIRAQHVWVCQGVRRCFVIRQTFLFSQLPPSPLPPCCLPVFLQATIAALVTVQLLHFNMSLKDLNLAITG